jgi:hypothetical protein
VATAVTVGATAGTSVMVVNATTAAGCAGMTSVLV